MLYDRHIDVDYELFLLSKLEIGLMDDVTGDIL
jgi:hypothetical protein